MKLINIILPLNIKILSKKERICCFLFYIFVPIIPLVLLYLKYADKNILLTALSIFIFMVCIVSPIFIYENGMKNMEFIQQLDLVQHINLWPSIYHYLLQV